MSPRTKYKWRMGLGCAGMFALLLGPITWMQPPWAQFLCILTAIVSGYVALDAAVWLDTDSWSDE